jgi:hypothetical protein
MVCDVGHHRLSDELDNTTGLLDLALGVLAEVAGTDDDWDLWETTLSEDLGVSEREEVEDWGGVGGLVGEELLALLNWDERPELEGKESGFSLPLTATVGQYPNVPCRG